MVTNSVRDDVGLESLVAQVADEFMERQRRGEKPTAQEYAEQHPEAANLLRKVLTALEVLDLSAATRGNSAAGEEPATGTLGDYRLIREVGRGGMGVVYEAQQISLGRRVALKVLPFAATMDKRQMQRFQNEARAAASLEHPHIVPVYGVGCERGVHYYAMRFIEGLSLDVVLQQLRAKKQPASPPSALEPDPSAAVAQKSQVRGGPKSRAGLKSTLDKVRGKASTLQSNGSAKNRVHQIAKIGVQAAMAMEHAHQSGVVHRDIKPANLLVDNEGHLWITDFGLAQIQNDPRLTMTGDLVGTLRYMSPEQALANRVIVDHRTDIYSLGATLYEMLTLQPVFSGADRQELLRQIAFEEPVAARKVNREVPVELETIVGKALEKNPDDRYGSAKEMADDLRRYLNDEPTLARRPSLWQRGRKWARRHVAAGRAAAVAVFVIITALASMAGWWLNDRALRQAVAVGLVNEALAVMEPKLREGNPYDPQLVSAARRAEAQLASGLIPRALHVRAKELLTDWSMLETLDGIRMDKAIVDQQGNFDIAQGDSAYGHAFRAYDIDVGGMAPQDAAARIREKTIAVQLTAALDDWSVARKSNEKKTKTENWKLLLELAAAADPDRWRVSLRKALVTGVTKEELLNLANSKRIEELNPATVTMIADAINSMGAAEQAIEIVRVAQERHPADFWTCYYLASLHMQLKPPQLKQAIYYFRIALAVRPGSSRVHLGLGLALNDCGELPKAIAAYQESIRLKPDHWDAYNKLGKALSASGNVDQAITAYRKAIQLLTDKPESHYNLGLVLNRLGMALYASGEEYQAITAYRKAIHLRPDIPDAHNNLGLVLHKIGNLSGAIDAYREAIRLKSESAAVHHNLGNSLYLNGKLDEAIVEYREAILIDPDYARGYASLGIALQRKGDVEEAIANCRKAIQLEKDLAGAHNVLAWLFATCEDLRFRDPKAALESASRAVELQPKNAAIQNTLGVAYYRNGEWEKAIDALNQSMKLLGTHPAADYFFLAMSHWKLGDKDNARAWYHKGVRWIEVQKKPTDPELVRFRAEAAELVEIGGMEVNKTFDADSK